MTPRQRIGWLFVGAAVLARSITFVFAKMAAISSTGKALWALALNPWYVGEIAALSLQALAWTLALRRLPLTLAYPFTSLVYGVNLASAHFVFGESINLVHVIGMSVIMAGVTLSSRAVSAVEAG